ncbi:hypothetical protein WG66_011839 [Moniliophthora roreri]|nr:hypothetical protein WG66_011839 [Moniliophthora roreri]
MGRDSRYTWIPSPRLVPVQRTLPIRLSLTLPTLFPPKTPNLHVKAPQKDSILSGGIFQRVASLSGHAAKLA